MAELDALRARDQAIVELTRTCTLLDQDCQEASIGRVINRLKEVEI